MIRSKRSLLMPGVLGIGLAAAALVSPATAALIPLVATGSDYGPLSTNTPGYATSLPSVVTPANLMSGLESATQSYSTTVGNSTIAGTLTSNVYKDPITGYLTFVYKLNATGASTEAVARLTLNAWTAESGLQILNNGADGTGTTATAATGSYPGWTNGNPNSINWDSNDNLNIQFRSATGNGTEGTQMPAGDFSAEVFFQTNSTSEFINNAGISDGVTANVPYLGPTNAVPEPATMSLLLIGGGGALLRRRRRTPVASA